MNKKDKSEISKLIAEAFSNHNLAEHGLAFHRCTFCNKELREDFLIMSKYLSEEKDETHEEIGRFCDDSCLCDSLN